MDPDLARAVAFVQRLENGLAGELAVWEGGTAVINRRSPDMWDMNFLRLERPWARGGEALAGAVDHAARAVGIATPIVAVPSPDDAAALGPALEAAGFVRDVFVVMAARREPDRAAPGVAVEELRYADVRDEQRAMAELPWKSGEEPSSPELVEQILALEARVSDLVDDRWYAVRAAGGAGFAAMCELRSADGVGQVESVTTLPGHRGKGYGSAVVLAALAGVASGGQHTDVHRGPRGRLAAPALRPPRLRRDRHDHAVPPRGLMHSVPPGVPNRSIDEEHGRPVAGGAALALVQAAGGVRGDDLVHLAGQEPGRDQRARQRLRQTLRDHEEQRPEQVGHDGRCDGQRVGAQIDPRDVERNPVDNRVLTSGRNRQRIVVDRHHRRPPKLRRRDRQNARTRPVVGKAAGTVSFVAAVLTARARPTTPNTTKSSHEPQSQRPAPDQ